MVLGARFGWADCCLPRWFDLFPAIFPGQLPTREQCRGAGESPAAHWVLQLVPACLALPAVEQLIEPLCHTESGTDASESLQELLTAFLRLARTSPQPCPGAQLCRSDFEGLDPLKLLSLETSLSSGSSCLPPPCSCSEGGCHSSGRGPCVAQFAGV